MIYILIFMKRQRRRTRLSYSVDDFELLIYASRTILPSSVSSDIIIHTFKQPAYFTGRIRSSRVL